MANRSDGLAPLNVPPEGRWEKRHTQVALVALCSAINYADRVNISIAVVDMKQTFQWNMGTQALVLSSFFWGCESPPLHSLCSSLMLCETCT
jgi:hypothetical protein